MSTYLKVQPTRMSGAGNTFFIIVDSNLSKIDKKETVKKICNEYVGFATDGVLFLTKNENSAKNFHAEWDFYNSDGSHAEMCGNAARCAGLYYFNKINTEKKIIFKTAAGMIEAEIISPQEGIVRVKMPIIKAGAGIKMITLKNKNIKGYFVNTGVPHFVIQRQPNEELAKELRKINDFGEAGANITFVEFDDSDFIQAVTFERGVENFTLACGTGAVAAARYHHECYPEINFQKVEMPGGLLQVEWKDQDVFLLGLAEFHFDLNLYKQEEF